MDEHLKGTHMLIVRPDEQLGSPGSSANDIQWKIVSQLVEDYVRVHPNEIKEVFSDNVMLSQISKNTHSSNDEGLRYALRTPPGLVRVIERRFPNFFIDKNNLHRFMETFKAFRIPETI